MLAINETLQGRYLIIRQLGHGGMGAVYEAKDTKRFDKPVAVKEILLDFAKIPNPRQQELVRRAFEREAKILTQLEDDAFPKVIEYFLETDRQFLVMELIPGDDLAALLEKRQGAFPLEEVLQWADQLLDALVYLHTLNPPIIHRDIKPHNLKLNSRRKIKLLDFGIAKDTGAEMSSTITNETFVGATLNYSPLEQLLRIPLYCEPLRPIYGEKVEKILQQPADARSDIYALGATLYHLLTNVLPIDGYRRVLQTWAGKPDPLKSPRELNPNIPTDISDILLKSIQIEREHRFDTAQEMQTAINETILRERRRKEEEERIKWFEAQEKIKLEERRRIETEALPQTVAETFTGDQTEDEDLSFLETQPLDTKPSTVIEHSSTASGFDEAKLSETEASMSETSPSYLDGIEFEPENAPGFVEAAKDGKPFVKPVPREREDKKPVWIYAVAAVALLLFGGAGIWAFFMFANSDGTNKNKIITNAANVTPTITPTAEPTVSPTVSPTVEPTPSPYGSNKGVEKPEPSVEQSTPNRNPTPRPTRKPPNKTPKPKQDPNCVFTNSCQ
jgi:serine/threonine protein kinase